MSRKTSTKKRTPRKGAINLQPRNSREQALVDDTLARAEEIREAREYTEDRAVLISPHTSKKAKQAAQLRRDAVMLFELYHDESIPAAARAKMLEHVQDIYSDVAERWPEYNRPLFVSSFIKGWQQQGILSEHSRRNVSEILERLKAGESLESIMLDWTQQTNTGEVKALKRTLDSPEPKDNTSDEWRYWKLRRMEHALSGDDTDAFTQAWKEFKAMLAKLPGQCRVHDAVCMLPHIIIARQEYNKRTAKKGKKRVA